MHQSHRRHRRRLLNADALDGERIGVLEYRTRCIICCWQRLPVRSALLFSLFQLAFASFTFAVTLLFIHVMHSVAHHIY